MPGDRGAVVETGDLVRAGGPQEQTGCCSEGRRGMPHTIAVTSVWTSDAASSRATGPRLPWPARNTVPWTAAQSARPRAGTSGAAHPASRSTPSSRANRAASLGHGGRGRQRARLEQGRPQGGVGVREAHVGVGQAEQPVFERPRRGLRQRRGQGVPQQAHRGRVHLEPQSLEARERRVDRAHGRARPGGNGAGGERRRARLAHDADCCGHERLLVGLAAERVLAGAAARGLGGRGGRPGGGARSWPGLRRRAPYLSIDRSLNACSRWRATIGFLERRSTNAGDPAAAVAGRRTRTGRLP